MKVNLILPLPFILFSLLLSSNVMAETDITGEIHGRTIGIMNMEPENAGVTIEDVGTLDHCDDTLQICYLEGFSWADTIGWTAWDGNLLETDIIANAGIFPDEYFAKTSYKGSLGGYIWSEKTGWIQLSSCAGEEEELACEAHSHCLWTTNNLCDVSPSGLTPEVSTQTANEWGAYIDFCPLKTNQASCESIESNPYCNWDGGNSVCMFDSQASPDGHPLRGYAWSEKLGWLKFGTEAGDIGFLGAFTQWFPDLTPPDVNALLGNAWIPNSDLFGTIHWQEFADENDSQINLIDSQVEFALDPDPGYAGCSPGGLAVINQNGGIVDLDFPGAGLVDETVLNKHCKYELNGVLYNGSGFGYFLGADAKTLASNAGVNVSSPSPHIIDTTPAYLFTMAGEMNLDESSLGFSGSAVADGTDSIETSLRAVDSGGNPIVSIPFDTGGLTALPKDAVRNVYMSYELDATEHIFDRVEMINNIGVPAPLEVGQFRQQYLFPHTTITFPVTGEDDMNYSFFTDAYRLPIFAYAPTAPVGSLLELSALNFHTNNKTGQQIGLGMLPSVSPSMPAWNLVSSLKLNENTALMANPLPYSYSFEPMLEVANAKLDSEFILIGQEVEASFDLINNSPSLVLENYALDHIPEFINISGGIGEELLEIKNINLDGLMETTGRTDPDSGYTRYELLRDTKGLADLQFNEFHSANSHFHFPDYDFVYDPVDATGEYSVSGSYYAGPAEEGPFADVILDRTDPLGFSIDPEATESFSVNMTPSQYIGEVIDAQVEFNIGQYLAYNANPNRFWQFAIYPATVQIDGVEVKNIGLNTSGIVSGGQIFETVGGRDLEAITTTSSADLRKDVRRNVAQLTRNMDLSDCDAEQNPLDTLPTTASDCVLVDPINKTIVAAFTGGTLNVGGAGTITIPADYKYTLILMDGASVYLTENMTYGPSNTNSFGLIALQDKNGKGGNVYLDPAPTNMVGLLYAEGSILSTPDGGDSFYYGAGGDSTDLTHQLYWQGSLASRNTVGGFPSKIIPTGVDCSPWPDQAGCAQAHDLDFIRRFATFNENGDEFSLPGYQFSGGGSCNGTYPLSNCVNGAQNLPSTVSISGGFLDEVNSKSLDTFFIERDNRPVPLGFNSRAGLISTQAIR